LDDDDLLPRDRGRHVGARRRDIRRGAILEPRRTRDRTRAARGDPPGVDAVANAGPAGQGRVHGRSLDQARRRAAADVTDDVIYLAMAIRNAGTGVAVLDRWDVCTEELSGDAMHGDPAGFHRLTRDIFLSGGDFGFWQGALRDSAESQFAAARAAIEERRRITIDLLYGDLEGGQRTVSRFGILPAGDDGWLAVVVRHWNLDRPNPRERAR
jgi:hypothetical protein